MRRLLGGGIKGANGMDATQNVAPAAALLPGIRVKLTSIDTTLPQITPINVFVNPECTICKLKITIRNRIARKIVEIGNAQHISSVWPFGNCNRYSFLPSDALFLLTRSGEFIGAHDRRIADLAQNPENLDENGFLVIMYRKESVFG